MEAAILAHVHPLGLTFRPGGGQALPLPTVNLPTLYVLLHMIAVEIHHQLNHISFLIFVSIMCFLDFLKIWYTHKNIAKGIFLRPLGHVGPLIGLYTSVIR